MPGEEYKILLREDAVPFAISTPRRVPFALREPLLQELQKLEADGIITPVTTPTDWCAPIVVTPKKTGGVRLCVDLSKLNASVRRELYQSNTPVECVASIAAEEAKFFGVFDALKGYHQCPLDAQSQPLTTFTTPFGRYMYLRAPYGVSSISEHYNRRMDQCFQGLPGIQRLVDDVIVYGRTREEFLQRTRLFFERCRQNGVSLNRDKVQFGQPSVKFAGFVLSPDGYTPDPALTEAISNFPAPKDLTELRSFFGLANQIAPFSDAVSQHLLPLRPLLSSKREFVWQEPHQDAFLKARAALSSAPTLAFYDPGRPTRLSTDASRLHGLGYLLQQKQDDATWRVVQAGSRFISDTEGRYAAIELELTAVAWAFRKCRLFLSGLAHFDVIIDHRPLVPILNSKTLDELENPRLQRLKMKLGELGSFTAHWTKGSQHLAADALSRSPVRAAGEEDMVDADQDEPSASHLFTVSAGDDLQLDEVRAAAAQDETAQSLLRTVVDGFPSRKADLPVELRPYWAVHEHLAVDDGLVVYGRRLVVPAALRSQVLRQLHASHLGKELTKQRARQIVYWPRIDNDVDNIVRNCTACQRELPSQPQETLLHRPPPSRPFEEISMDFGDYGGHKFLIAVDHCSGWQSVADLGTHALTSQLISATRDIFCIAGVPNTLWSDGGPQFRATAFQEFLKRWGVTHRTSSPRYPQSNGRAEAAVKATKKLIRRCWNPQTRKLDQDPWVQGVLQHRNTPGPCGRTPAEILYGRPVRDMLPAHRRNFAAEWQTSADEAEVAAARRQDRVEELYNSRATDLPALQAGNKVAIQDQETKRWDRYGEIVEVGDHRRYFIKLASGRVLCRNRRHLRRRYGHAPPDATPPPVDYAAAPTPCPRPAAPAGDVVAVEPLPTPVDQTQRAAQLSGPRRSRRATKRPERLIETMQ
jgi:transposase InsO family protein